MQRLKPCPICGEEPKMFRNGHSNVISCLNPNCGARLETMSSMPKEDVVKLWNRRPEEQKLLASIECLTGQIDQQQQIISRLQENQSRLYQAFIHER